MVSRLFSRRVSVGFHQSSLVYHGPTSQTGATTQTPVFGLVTRTEQSAPHSTRLPQRGWIVPGVSHGQDEEVHAGKAMNLSSGTIT